MNNDITIPNHIAIIMDGNGRWAKQKLIPKKMGHRKGSEVAEKIIKYCKEIGVSYLTLFTFSSENWSRSEEEVDDLLSLLRDYLQHKAKKLVEIGIKILFIGNRSLLPKDIVLLMGQLENISKDNKFTLIMAISYGSRDEIVSAAKAMASYVKDNNIDEIDYNLFENFINPHNIPDPDLLIRTSGELRLSNFLLWQLAYSELCFINKLWPDFDEVDMYNSIVEFARRDRRYGR
jgi:undecaprenyl diphosphate synthase